MQMILIRMDSGLRQVRWQRPRQWQPPVCRGHGRAPRAAAKADTPAAETQAVTIVRTKEIEMGKIQCQDAVMRAYQSMIAFGEGHHSALRVADRVFRWHKPHTPDEQREAIILSWVTPNWLN